MIASSAIEAIIDSALSINAFLLILSMIPTHYYLGEIFLSSVKLEAGAFPWREAVTVGD